MAKVEEDFGHRELVDGSVTTLHSHPGGGADVRSGVIPNVNDGSWGTVVFSAEGIGFASLPQITLTLKATSSALATDIPFVTYITTNGFEWEIHKGHGGANHTWDVIWIATDAGT